MNFPFPSSPSSSSSSQGQEGRHSDNINLDLDAGVTQIRPITTPPRLHNKNNVINKELHFPAKLYIMLEAVDNLALSHVVSWLPNGQGFHVKDASKFMDIIAPHFFKATKYRSFQRQLNLWGFIRCKYDGENASWCHKFFSRGHPEKLSNIIRTKIKGNGNRKTSPKQVPSVEGSSVVDGDREDGKGGVRLCSDCESNITPLKTSSNTNMSVVPDDLLFDLDPEYADYYKPTVGRSNQQQLSPPMPVSSQASSPLPESVISDDIFHKKINSMAMFSPTKRPGCARRVTFDGENCQHDFIEPLPLSETSIPDTEKGIDTADLDAYEELLGQFIV